MATTLYQFFDEVIHDLINFTRRKQIKRKCLLNQRQKSLPYVEAFNLLFNNIYLIVLILNTSLNSIYRAMLNNANFNFVYFSIHITIRQCIFTEILKRFREWHDNLLVTALISMPIIVFILFLFYTMLPYFLLKTLVLFVVSKGQTQTKLTL